MDAQRRRRAPTKKHPRKERTAQITFHPAANVFPMIEGTAFEELVADLKAHGLREPIVRHPDGRILDGRNRYRACIKAGVEPRFETWDKKGSAVAFVLSLNVHRRHLDESQRAMVAARLATLRDGQRRNRASPIGEATTQAEAASLLNVGKRTVERARTVLDSGDADLIGACDRGEKKLGRAVADLQRAQREAGTSPKGGSPSKGSASEGKEGSGEQDWKRLIQKLDYYIDAIMKLLKEAPDEGWYENVRSELLTAARQIELGEFIRE